MSPSGDFEPYDLRECFWFTTFHNYVHWPSLLPEHTFPSPANPLKHWHVATSPSEMHWECGPHPTGPQSSSSANSKNPIRLTPDLRGKKWALMFWVLQNIPENPFSSSGTG